MSAQLVCLRGRKDGNKAQEYIKPTQVFMKTYELLFIVPGTLTEEEVAPQIATVQEAVAGIDAADAQLNDLGKAKLAYPMRHIRYGYFYTITFSADPAKVPTLRSKLNLNKTLLRVLLNEAKDANKTRDNVPEGLITIEKKQDLIDERKKAVARHKENQTPVAAPKAVEAKAETPEEAAPAEEATPEEAPAEKLDQAEIDKKLDDIIKGDDISESV